MKKVTKTVSVKLTPPEQRTLAAISRARKVSQSEAIRASLAETWERIRALKASHGAPAPVGDLAPVKYVIDALSRTELDQLAELEAERE
jgi:Arc/MetJ-type ribon-helix-helix transcriptional regulator